jgi:hypothetical protein
MKTNLRKAFLTMMATLGLGMLVLGSTTTWAADMCFLDDYGSTLVGKNFSFPAAGACKAFNGYELGTNCIISGAACGTSNNADIRFNLNISCPFGYFGISSFRIDRLYSNINQAGYGYAYQTNTGAFTQWHIKTVPCPNPRPLN